MRQAVPTAYQLGDRIAYLRQPLMLRKEAATHQLAVADKQATLAQLRLLENCMLRCCEYIEQVTTTGWMCRFVRADKIMQDFISLNVISLTASSLLASPLMLQVFGRTKRLPYAPQNRWPTSQKG